jgi:hypothetical protein
VSEEDPAQPSAAGPDRPLRILQIASPWVPVPPEQYGGSEWIAHWLCEGMRTRGHDVTLVATADSSTDVRVVSAFDEYYRRLSERVALVAISRAQLRHLPDARWAATIPNAIDVSSFPVGDGGEDFVFLGRIAREKGAHLAAEAAHRAGASLVLAGRVEVPEEEAYFEERLRPLIDDRVLFLGEVDTEQKRSLLAGARALLFPIEWDEPFGMVVVEALACGTPVVAFRRGAVPELVEDGVTGFVVDDVEGMIDAMGEIGRLDRAACRRSVEGRFDIDRMVRDYEALYRRVSRGAG